MSKAFDAYMDGTTDTEKIDAVQDADWKVGDIILVPTGFGNLKEKARITDIDSSNIWYTSLREGNHSYFNRNCAAIKEIEKVGDSACDGGELTQADLKVGLKVREGNHKGIITQVDADGDPWVKFADGSFGKVRLYDLAKDSACDSADDDAAYACKYILANSGSVQAKIHGLMVSGLPHDVMQKLHDAFNAICDAKNAAYIIVMKSKRK